jgi:hypothetical protein
MNLHGYGTTEPMPMIQNYSILWNEGDGMWVLKAKCEGMSMTFFGGEQEEAIEKYKAWVLHNRMSELEPDAC